MFDPTTFIYVGKSPSDRNRHSPLFPKGYLKPIISNRFVSFVLKGEIKGNIKGLRPTTPSSPVMRNFVEAA